MKPARLLCPLAVLVALAAPSCGDSTTPTEPSATAGSPIQEIFSTTLSPRGSTFYSFASSFTGAARVTLIGVTDAAGAVVTPALTLGFGVPKGTGCGATSTVAVTPGLVSHITAPIAASIYCVSLTDPGNLTGDVTFYMRIAYPLATIPSGVAGPETWASLLTPAGTATRTFIATAPGVASIRIDSLSGSSAPVDFALGIPNTDGRGCYFTRAIRTPAGSGSEISLPVDPGLYCVRIADTGQLTANTNFSITIGHP
jgi:hypothetical protein